MAFALSLPLHADDFEAGGVQEAAFNGDLKQVQALLSEKPELLNDAGKSGTPLFAATLLWRKEVIGFLLSKGADLNLPNRDGLTPLHLAASQGYPEVVKQFLAAKANPAAKSNDGTTALHLAAEYDRAEIVDQLVAAKADVNARDNEGMTALHRAATRTVSRGTLVALVAAGADLNAEVEKGQFAGKTPLQIKGAGGKGSFLQTLSELAPRWSGNPDLPAELAEPVRALKLMSLALYQFSALHGSYPNEQTAGELEKKFKGTVPMGTASADDFFKQVVFTTEDRKSLEPCIVIDGNKQRWICAYVPGASPRSDARRPVVFLPLVDGKPLFDPAIHGGKAVILFADSSVRFFPIEPDGRVLIDGKDVFDPKQPFWEGGKPEIKWPMK